MCSLYANIFQFINLDMKFLDLSVKLMHRYIVHFCHLKWRGKWETEGQSRLARALKNIWILPGFQTALDQGGTTFRRRSQGNPLSSTYRSGERNHSGREMSNGTQPPHCCIQRQPRGGQCHHQGSAAEKLPKPVCQKNKASGP